MQETDLMARIVDRMSLLNAHVSERADHGLLDATNGLETLYREILNLTRGWQLTSTNFPERNFPAVDLHDPATRLAVQVTVTCDTAKIVATQDTFQRHELAKRYDRLIFVGIRSVKRSKKLASWAEIYKQSDLLNLTNLDLHELKVLEDRLAHSVPWHQFTQQSDRHCFDVVLGVLDRDAIRHMTHVEGDFEDMLVALRAIKQVINQGTVHGTAVTAKPLALYSDPYAQILEEIDVHVGRMSSIVRRELQPYNFLPHHAASEVDRERLDLIKAVNDFCMEHDHRRRIEPWGP